MKFRLLQFLHCPDCGGALTVSEVREKSIEGPSWVPPHKCSACALALHDPAAKEKCGHCATREVVAGKLTCACGSVYPILNCVPVLLPGQAAPGGPHEENRKTSQRFGYEWTRYPAYFHDEEFRIFFEETQLSPQELEEKLILDAGCGMGRFTRIAGAQGCEVIGVDISESVHRAHALTAHMPNVHIIQADLMQLPLRNASFDIIYSLGVLHHTPSTPRAFAAVAGKLKQGGLLSVWVYGTAGPYKNFKTNPLRPDRSRYLSSDFAWRLYWLLVLVREKLSNGLRRITVTMPHRLLYRLCYGLALAGKIPLIKYCTFSAHAVWRVRLLENFDWLAPPFQYHHTKEEMLSWCEKEGVAVERMLEHGFIPKVGVRGRKK